MPLSRDQEFRLLSKRAKNEIKIEECFYHKTEECRGQIKKTHSIQKKGRLSLLEGNYNGNQVIFSFANRIQNENNLIIDLVPIGKNEASTFFGFCDYHDSKLFSSIENEEFDGSLKHCFLHSYRSFAHSFLRSKEELRLFEEGMLNRIIQDNILIIPKGINEIRNDFIDLSKKKKLIDESIENSNYNIFYYYQIKLNGLFPFACSSIIQPPRSISNKIVNDFKNPNEPLTDIILTVLPDKRNTIIIFAAFSNDKKAISFIEELSTLPNQKLKVALTSLLISCTENTFFSPNIWLKLGKHGRKQLLKELNKYIQSPNKIPNTFFLSKLNLFEIKYQEKTPQSFKQSHS